MSFIFTSDIHLDDKPGNEYRWGLFPWLAEQAKTHKVDCIFIGGDLTDLKNNHDAVFVNRIVDTLVTLAQTVKVVLFKGNHDFVDEGTPFFKFINLLNIPNLVYCIEPTVYSVDGKKCLILPCTRNHTEVWNGLDFKGYDFIFCHETFDGAVSETGIALRGIPHSIFSESTATIISGDIHVPQLLGKIIYCGAPYRIRFGDSFTPRVILCKGNKLSDLHFKCMQKHTIELFDAEDTDYEKDVSVGDQIKFRLYLRRSEILNWDRYRKLIALKARERSLNVHGIELKVIDSAQSEFKEQKQGSLTPNDYFERYCHNEKLGKLEQEIGRKLLSE